MKNKKSYDKIHSEISKLKEEINEKYHNIISILFSRNPSLKSFELSCREEFNDHNYYTQVSIVKINGIELPEEISSVYYLNDGGYSLKSFYIESKTKEDLIKEIIGQIIEEVPSSFFDNDGGLSFKRDDYV